MRKSLQSIFIVILCCGLLVQRDRLYAMAVAVVPALEAMTAVISAACSALVMQSMHDNKQLNKSSESTVRNFLDSASSNDLYALVREAVKEQVPNLGPTSCAVAPEIIATNTAQSDYASQNVLHVVQEHIRITNQPRHTNYALEVAAQHMRAVMYEQFVCDYMRVHNVAFKDAIEARLWQVNSTIVVANSRDVTAEARIQARFGLLQCSLPGIWGQHLATLVRHLTPYYFYADGRIKIPTPSPEVTHYIARYFTDAYQNAATQKLFLVGTGLPDADTYASSVGTKRSFFKQIYHSITDAYSYPKNGLKFSAHAREMVVNNAYNQVLWQALAACDNAHFVQAYALARRHQNTSSLIAHLVHERYVQFAKTWQPIFDTIFTPEAIARYQKNITDVPTIIIESIPVQPVNDCMQDIEHVPAEQPNKEDLIAAVTVTILEDVPLYTPIPEPVKARECVLTQTIEEILAEGVPGKETKGNSKQFIKYGTFEDANNDFDSLALIEIKDLGNQKRGGQLLDGRILIVRPSSSEDLPTLEVHFPGKKYKIKIRYIKG